eukprot:scpid32941/ scgid30966/ 
MQLMQLKWGVVGQQQVATRKRSVSMPDTHTLIIATRPESNGSMHCDVASSTMLWVDGQYAHHVHTAHSQHSTAHSQLYMTLHHTNIVLDGLLLRSNGHYTVILAFQFLQI